MKKITLVGITIGLFLFFAIKAQAIDKTRIMNSDGIISPTNPLDISGTFTQAEGTASETTLLLVKELLQNILDENDATETTLAQIKTLQDLIADYTKQLSDTINPDSRLVTVTLFNTAKDGSGTFYYPILDSDGKIMISGSVGVESPLAIYPEVGYTYPVSGTFWQGTQPVSIATMPSTPVTGTFWQVTQPVSATDLDIRDLTSVSDSVEAKQSTPTDLKIQIFGDDTTSAINTDANGDVQVDIATAPDLSLTDLTYGATIVNVTCADTTLWYDYTLPADTVGFITHGRTGYDIKVSMDSDGAAYWTMWAGESFPPPMPIRDGYIAGTYYFNVPNKADFVIELYIQRKP